MKSIAILNAFALCVCLTAATAAQEKTRQPPVEIPMEQQYEMARKSMPLRGGPDFYIEPIAGPHINYSILVTDANHRSVPGTFIRQQIEILEDLLVAAKTFALNEEEVGPVNKPKVTRFMDKHEKSFIIDVAKGGDKSHFYLTIESLFGRLTVDAGIIKRGVKKPNEEEPEPLYYKIITRVQEAKNAPPPIPQSQQ
ncbi:MAG TPA: hypothetical protein VKA60_22585 [Blastocatellia bacterium]|nr:hypothetical protein [Blastocatellia bacterium]